jgi:hypothetical protein
MGVNGHLKGRTGMGYEIRVRLSGKGWYIEGRLCGKG